jgi:hypothetical protein
VLFKSNDGINFDTANGGDGDIDVLTLNVTGTPKLWWDESVDAFSLTKRLFIGDTQTTASDDPMVNVNRAVNDDVAGNGHCFSDSSTITRGGRVAYNSFDARITVSGVEDYDHFACFQSYPKLGTTGTTTRVYGLYSALSVDAGTVTNTYGVYVSDPIGAGTVTNAYGCYVPQLTKGVNTNYAFYAAGTTWNYFGGHTAIGMAPHLDYSLAIGGAHTLVSNTYKGVRVESSATHNITSFETQATTSGAGVITTQMGLYVRHTHASGGALTNRYDVYLGPASTGGTVGARYGLYVADQTGAGNLTNQYGVYVAALAKGGTLNYALYTAGATPSRFEGPLHFKNVAGPNALADGAVLYATDQADGNSCIHAKTEGGAVVKLYQQEHIADADAGTIVTQFNALLAAIENTGLLAAA